MHLLGGHCYPGEKSMDMQRPLGPSLALHSSPYILCLGNITANRVVFLPEILKANQWMLMSPMHLLGEARCYPGEKSMDMQRHLGPSPALHSPPYTVSVVYNPGVYRKSKPAHYLINKQKLQLQCNEPCEAFSICLNPSPFMYITSFPFSFPALEWMLMSAMHLLGKAHCYPGEKSMDMHRHLGPSPALHSPPYTLCVWEMGTAGK
ncbi:hypothetical protein CEXT_608751 [Caerostris extrusa]|uniref:Uncharacterized protein n=1 Tax=Caerostris extrusa TaxID=172846 RepID=A0AAV4TZK9_CAEEX|nr:hypothetical protein CEXT_608751 [Caerostris extrusa]